MNILLNCISLILQGIPHRLTFEMVPITMTVILIMVFAVIFIFNRLIKRRIRRISRQSNQAKNLMQQALRSCDTNVILYDPSKDYTFKLYGHMIPASISETENPNGDISIIIASENIFLVLHVLIKFSARWQTRQI